MTPWAPDRPGKCAHHHDEALPRLPRERKSHKPEPKLFYELGYAHALDKPTILLAQRDAELPFDIRSYRVIFYENSIGGKALVEESLPRHLSSILKDL
jgi:hypothetical protein